MVLNRTSLDFLETITINVYLRRVLFSHESGSPFVMHMHLTGNRPCLSLKAPHKGFLLTTFPHFLPRKEKYRHLQRILWNILVPPRVKPLDRYDGRKKVWARNIRYFVNNDLCVLWKCFCKSFKDISHAMSQQKIANFDTCMCVFYQFSKTVKLVFGTLCPWKKDKFWIDNVASR